MTEKNNLRNQDEIMRQLMHSSKLRAPENLKYRIMHQIETERALARKTAPASFNGRKVLKDFIGIFGSMYAVLAVLCCGAYLLKGREYVLSSDFLWTVILIAFVFSFFWLMSRVDEQRRNKREENRIPSK